MKKLSFLLIIFAALVVTSCGSGYDEKTCDDLIEKYKDKGELNSEDLAEVIRQCGAMADEYDSRLNKIMSGLESDDESEQEKALDDYYELLYKSELVKQDQKLSYILEHSDLKGDNKKAYKELKKDWKEKQREWKKIHRKAEKVTKRLDYEIDWNDLISDDSDDMFSPAYADSDSTNYDVEEAVVEEAVVEETVVADSDYYGY